MGNCIKVDGTNITYLEGVLNRKRIPFTISVISLLGDVLSGILGAGNRSLLDMFGGAVGNTSILENILDHWNGEKQQSRNSTQRGLMKRQKTSSAWKLNLLKLGMKFRKMTI